MKLDLTGPKGVIASVLIVLSLIIGVLNAVQGALPPKIETLGVTNFDAIELSGDLSAANVTATTAISLGGNSLAGFMIISQAVTNGLTISHNLGALPKVICQPRAGGSATSITDTIWISATSTTTFTVGVVEPFKNQMSTDTVNVNCLVYR